MNIEPVLLELQGFWRKLDEGLTSKYILFRKVIIKQGNAEFSNVKGTIHDIPIETGSTCKILQRSADSNELFVFKLNRDLKFRGHVYFEPVWPHDIYNGLNYPKRLTSN